jgi:hypothetical protein
MIVEIFNDKSRKQFTVVIGAAAKAYTCKMMWLDEEFFDAEAGEDFEYIFVEARLVKIHRNVCVIETSMIEVLENEE